MDSSTMEFTTQLPDTSSSYAQDGGYSFNKGVLSLDQMGKRFTAWDYSIFCFMLSGSAFIGLYYACTGTKQRTAQEYLMGDRKMGIFPITMSLVASFTSAIAMLGYPAEVYSYGTLMMTSLIGMLLALPTVSYLYLPVFYNLGNTSVYQYLELRFNKTARNLGCGIYILQMLMYTAIVIYAPSMALSQVTGMNFWVAVGVTTGVCIFYTSIGGLKAVVWTDVFQMLLMIGTLFAVIVVGSFQMGGLANVWRIADKGERIQFFNFDTDPTVRLTTWALVIGKFFIVGASYGCNQTNIQRYMALGSIKLAQFSVLLSMLGFAIFNSVSFFIGIVVYSKYSGCDPKTTGIITSPDQILPLFVVDTFRAIPGMAGFFVAGVMSASLSTISSVLNSLAAVTLEDFVKPYVCPKISEEKAGFVSKCLAVTYGFLCVSIILLINQDQNTTENTSTILGTVSGPLYGLFALGLFFPHANAVGSIVGLLAGISTCFWIVIGKTIYKPYWPPLPISTDTCYANMTAANITSHMIQQKHLMLLERNEDIFSLYRVSFLWYGVIGSFTVVIVGLIASFIYSAISKTNKPVERLLISPHVLSLFLKYNLVDESMLANTMKPAISANVQNGAEMKEMGQNGTNGASANHKI